MDTKTGYFNKAVIILATILSCIALYLSYTYNFILTYNDAASHLNIARRVIDNLTPGIAQIGTVWLPLPHFLMIPFAWNDYLWHTGFAGSIVSMASYIVSVFFLYKTIVLLTRSVTGGIIGAGVMALNPNFLYLQTTPMTEPLLIATFVLSVYFLARYLVTWEIQSLLICSFFVASATLIRYDGWFLFVTLSGLLPFWIWGFKNRKEAESSVILFVFMGGIGIVLWLLWNLAIFGDALYFATGPYSARAQQKILKEVGQLPTEGNIYNAVTYYMWAAISNNGLVIFITSAILTIFIPFFIKHKKMLLIFAAAFSPILFNIVALYAGQSAMNVPQASDNPGMFNTRYGMMAIPFIALTLGLFASFRIGMVVIPLLLITQLFMFWKEGTPISLADGAAGLKNTYYTVEASSWLKENYQGGLILTSLASHDAFVARTGLPMKNYIHEGTREYWFNALKNPGENVEYIAVLSFPPDSVYKAIGENPTFKTKYKLIHNYEKFAIYQRTD